MRAPSDKRSRKTLFGLIAALNQSYRPDCDFSTARSLECSREHSLRWLGTPSAAVCSQPCGTMSRP